MEFPIGWVLREDDGRAYLVNNVPGEVKIKGLGFDLFDAFWKGYSLGWIEQLLDRNL